MNVIHTIQEWRQWRRHLDPSRLLPFVPTMGALHDGHASLVRQAAQLAGTGAVAASIFVNPTQFGPTEDFAKYPRTLEADLAILNASGCTAVFVPTAEEMYGSDIATSRDSAISINPGPLGTTLEGALRPGHFAGVCTVVLKLLNIIQPTHLLLGQKDFQQQAVLRQMCASLNLPVEVVTCPTRREPDGLAMSSRNRYLSAEERPRAIALFEALSWAKDSYSAGQRHATTLEAGMHQRLTAHGLEAQYTVAAHPATLHLWRDAENAQIAGPAVFLIAAKLGATRLIDNILV